MRPFHADSAVCRHDLGTVGRSLLGEGIWFFKTGQACAVFLRYLQRRLLKAPTGASEACFACFSLGGGPESLFGPATVGRGCELLELEKVSNHLK
uniref:Secreted protein n=1 Tax=Steinernema glaseri TaxID=37863 RepID=A0A1I8A2K9_9BILA